MSDILKRRETHFVLWCPKPTTAPALIIGKIVNGNPPRLNPENPVPIPFKQVEGFDSLWQLDPLECDLEVGGIYHYWIEVDDTTPGKRVQATDPLAFTVDYRLSAPSNSSIQFPASVIQWTGDKLLASDPNGEKLQPVKAPFEKIVSNNKMVIYELPTAWVRTSGSDEFERAVGTFRDIHALIDANVQAANFPGLSVVKNNHLLNLGINALQLLPPNDSIYDREWGYGTTHYLAPDYELGYPEGYLSPTSNHDLTALINSCHENGIRIILDVVMGFARDEPYRNIDPDNFYLDSPEEHPDDPDAHSSRFNNDGTKQLRNSFGGSSFRYIKTKMTYDPMSGVNKQISPARQHMLTFLTRWMQDFQIDGIRMDSVENVANWDFIEDYKKEAHDQFRQRYGLPAGTPNTNFIVVGEELNLPMNILEQNRLDGLWNDRFRSLIRAALIGQSEGGDEKSFEWTVRKAIDSRIIGFSDGAKAVNYLTSHDVQDFRKERLYNFLINEITLEQSRKLFDEVQIKSDIRNANPKLREDEVQKRAENAMLHSARLRRIKLAFACLLTAVGIPMILAGEEFGDQHDLFDAHGNVTQEGGKQVDPVNFSRADEPERKKLFEYVSELVKLRKTHPALSVNDTEFIHVDFEEGKRVLVWKRGIANPVVVVANFSDYTTPNAPAPGTEYFVHNWPETPVGKTWFEVTQKRQITNGRPDLDSIFAWEAKVYHLIEEVLV